MSVGKRLLLFSPADPQASNLASATSAWGCTLSPCSTLEELRGKLQGSTYDMVLVEDSAVLRILVSESDPHGEILRTPLAEVEKRHILRVLSSTGGNKTQAARVLGIDTKTLYNKLKAYGASAAAYRRKAPAGVGAVGSVSNRSEVSQNGNGLAR